MKNCDTCTYCDIDFSTGTSECTNELEGLTEEEIVKYWENQEEGCPYYKSEVDAMNDFWEVAKNHYHTDLLEIYRN